MPVLLPIPDGLVVGLFGRGGVLVREGAPRFRSSLFQGRGDRAARRLLGRHVTAGELPLLCRGFWGLRGLGNAGLRFRGCEVLPLVTEEVERVSSLAARPVFVALFLSKNSSMLLRWCKREKGTCSGAFDPGTLEHWLTHLPQFRGRHPREGSDGTGYQRTTYPSRRFFFFDDFFSFFFDDGTGVSSGFLFPATWTSAPDEGDAPAAVPKR